MTLVVAAAGCGAGASPEEKWADSVCSSIDDWENQVQQAKDDISAKLNSPGSGTLAAINTDVGNAVDATNQLATELKKIGPPDTEKGAQAKQQLDALASQLQSTVSTAKQTVHSVPESANLAETAQKLAPLAPALQSLATATSSALTSIQESSEALKEGFDKADSCKEFR
jgi:uncharacterized phage infection (PIP) family protein YhgE